MTVGNSGVGPLTDTPVLHVPARDIPVPKHLSKKAQARLASAPHGPAVYPKRDDVEGWRQLITATDAIIEQGFLATNPPFHGEIIDIIEGDAVGFEIVPAGLPSGDRRVFLDIHGGALIMGGGKLAKAMGASMATRLNARVVGVDYRMAPDHPFPAGLDDCLAFYRRLLDRYEPSDIIVGGGSAGGNLAAATILRARDEGLPLPAAAVLITPELDLTESGDTFSTCSGIDAMGSLMEINLFYADGRSLDEPYVSPLFGDFSKGFPPSLITSGTRDLFLSNAVRMHRKLRAARIPAELHVLEAAVHGGFGGDTPEEAELDAEIRWFCDRIWQAA